MHLMLLVILPRSCLGLFSERGDLVNKNLRDELFSDRKTNAIKNWAREVIDEVKKVFGINSGKSLMREEVGKVLSSELGNGLSANMKEVVDAFKSAKTQLDYQRKLDLISDEKYYEGLEELRDRYFQQGTENWVKYTAEIYKYQKSVLENETKTITGIYDTVADYAEMKMQEVIKKQNKFSQALTDHGGIFMRNTVYMNGETDVYYSTRDMKRDIENVKSYASRISQLKELLSGSGISTEAIRGFLEEINGMGIAEGLSFMNYLFANGSENAIAYAGLWEEKSKLAKLYGEEFYKDEFEDVANEVAGTLKSALEEAGYSVPESFFESGKLSAINFANAFLEEIENRMVSIRERIAGMGVDIGNPTNKASVHNTTNNQYNITSQDSNDIIEKIRRFEAIKKLSGEG